MASQLRIGTARKVKASPMQSLIARATAGLPRPLTDEQIGSRAQASIDPVLGRITAAINQRARSATDAITGYSSSLASSLGGMDLGASYAAAAPKQASVDAALAQALSGGGTQLAGDLSSRLAALQEPGVVGDAAGRVAGQGAAAGATELASGSSALSELIANAASARGYGAKLPGIARLAGLQDVAGVQGAAGQQIADQTAQVESQLPSIVSNLRSQSDTRATNLSTAGERVREFQVGQQSSRASQAESKKAHLSAIIMGLGIDRKTGGLIEGAADALGEIWGVDPAALRGVSASTANAIIRSNASTLNARTRAATVKPAKLSTSASGRYGYQVDTSGRAILDAAGKRVPYPKTGSAGAGAGSGGLSAVTQRQAYNQAVKLAQQAQGTVTLGKKIGGQSFPHAYNSVVSYLVGVGYGGADAKRLALSAMGAAGWTVPTQVDVTP